MQLMTFWNPTAARYDQFYEYVVGIEQFRKGACCHRGITQGPVGICQGWPNEELCDDVTCDEYE